MLSEQFVTDLEHFVRAEIPHEPGEQFIIIDSDSFSDGKTRVVVFFGDTCIVAWNGDEFKIE